MQFFLQPQWAGSIFNLMQAQESGGLQTAQSSDLYLSNPRLPGREESGLKLSLLGPLIASGAQKDLFNEPKLPKSLSLLPNQIGKNLEITSATVPGQPETGHDQVNSQGLGNPKGAETKLACPPNIWGPRGHSKMQTLISSRSNEESSRMSRAELVSEASEAPASSPQGREVESSEPC
jgi:hypothetical protein